jgi:hypothetical protein
VRYSKRWQLRPLEGRGWNIFALQGGALLSPNTTACAHPPRGVSLPFFTVR